ncbi:hypothetical protein BDN70DRAFT_809507 [Pholiota conissans]|uniref:Yeast cell wall synthesis Kre9/Knh1-like N-terminal domain-containing protein n=1 Tax=Pholiota conissans TaxID=109636 RepID=A0A9P6CT59_9AGAR|nr:hypothetical protein BDN70DRAFT_809507 [Pholiota conissans]
MRVLGILLALISSAFAYSVLVPNANQGWTNQGVQPLEWQRAGTDRLNFSVFLVNQQISNFTPQLLGDIPDGTAQKTGCNPPQGGWPTGNGFQVNFVESDTAVSSILAQSDVFEIAKVAQVTVTSSVFLLLLGFWRLINS